MINAIDDRFPIYLQIRKLIVDGIANEDYIEGGTVPAARVLAEQHMTNDQTVRRAMSDLASGGYLNIIVGRGTYVSHGARDRARSEQGQLIAYDLTKMVHTARMIRMKQGEMIELVKAEFKKQLSEEE